VAKGPDVKERNPALSGSSDGLLKIVVLDVGEGASQLVMSPEGEAALIDTGIKGSLKDRLGGINIKYLFITHDDSDHNGDMENVGIPPTEFKSGDLFYLGGDVRIETLLKDCEYIDGFEVECENDNESSAGLLISFGGFKYLVTGDLPGGGGEAPYTTIDMETHLGELAGDIDVLHVGHHGSNTSTNQGFLELTSPEAAIISVGNNNDYWHPHLSVIKRLIQNDIEIFQTERGWLKNEFVDKANILGNVTIESDGISYDIH